VHRRVFGRSGLKENTRHAKFPSDFIELETMQEDRLLPPVHKDYSKMQGKMFNLS
jgi:hypothetical protein